MRWMFLAVALVGVGCGVPDDALLAELDDEDWEKVCEELEPAVSAECSEGDVDITVTAYGPAECLAAAQNGQVGSGCDATAGDYRICMDELHDDPCLIRAEDPPEACARVLSCIAL